MPLVHYTWHNKQNPRFLTPITQIYGVCFDTHGNVLITRTPNKPWNIPGGTPQKNETPEKTLKRELREEVNVTLAKTQMIGYFKVTNETSFVYQLRYVALIDLVFPQTADPDTGEVYKRKFVDPTDFFDYITYNEYRPMLATAVKWYETNISPSQP